MKVQVIGRVRSKYNKDLQQYETIIDRIDGICEIEFDPLNDKFAITDDKELRYLLLNRDKYRLSLKSFKECRRKNLVGYRI